MSLGMIGLARKDMLLSIKQNTSISKYGSFQKKVRKMYQDSVISNIDISQLGEKTSIVYEANECNHLRGPDPTSRRISWLLGMCFSMHDRERIVPFFSSFGWDVLSEEIHLEGFSQQIAWKNTEYVRCFLGAKRTWSVRVQIRLGSQLIGWIRQQAVRNIEVVQGLMIEPTFSFRFSMRIDNLFLMGSSSFSDFQLGPWSIPISDRPDWLGTLLYHLQGCFCLEQGMNIAQLAKEKMLSVEGFTHYRQFCSSIPSVGVPRVVAFEDENPKLLLNDELVSMYGDEERKVIRQAAAVFLSGCSIVWLDEEPVCELPDFVQVWYTTSKGEKVGKKSNQRTLQWSEKTP